MIWALNLGCGNDYRESSDDIRWVNIDSGDCKTDISHDIELIPYPVDSDYFDTIVAQHVLEHISKDSFPRVVRELYRISNNRAVWEIAVPHGFSDNFITDPTHKMPFSLRTFDYFMDGKQLRENGIIYGWGDIHLEHISPPEIDSNQTIHFKLRVHK